MDAAQNISSRNLLILLILLNSRQMYTDVMAVCHQWIYNVAIEDDAICADIAANEDYKFVI